MAFTDWKLGLVGRNGRGKTTLLDLIQGKYEYQGTITPRLQTRRFPAPSGEMGASFIGVQARLMSQAMRKLSGIVNKTDTIVIFINQLREKIKAGIFSPKK